MSEQKYRSRCYNLELYPDNDAHMGAMEFIRSNYHYVAILHDKDLKDDGSLVKPHYHVCVKFSQARWNTALAEELGIETRWMEKTGCWDSSALYLLHVGKDEKYQYPSDALEGDLAPSVCALLVVNDENERVISISDLLDKQKVISYRSFVRMCCEAGLWSDVRRMGVWGVYLLNEHNHNFREYEKEFPSAFGEAL